MAWAALVAWGCGWGPLGCDTVSPEGPDQGVDSAVVDVGGVDLKQPPDADPDISPPDTGPASDMDTSTPYATCKVGRVRTLSPKPVSRGKGVSCGTDCKQVTFNTKADGVGKYDLWENHLVYISSIVGSEVYLVDLAANKEWELLRHPPMTAKIIVAAPGLAVFAVTVK